MKKLVCKECNYRLRSESGQIKKCPYCGKDTLIDEPNAEDLLK
ncbi:MAG: hypothetical protein ABIA78_03355 [archaeon]